MRSFYLLALMCFSALTASLSVISCSSSVKNKLFSSDTKSYRDAVKDLNFEAAHDILSSYREDYLLDMYKDDEVRVAAQEKYYQAFDYIYKSEIQYILSELRGDECKDKIVFLLEEIPVEGEKKPAGLCDFSVATRGSWGNDGIPFDAYIIWTQHYNRLCSSILSLAINRKNQDLAKLIIQKFVDNVEVTIIDGNGYINYTSEDRNAAKEQYNEAVRSGILDDNQYCIPKDQEREEAVNNKDEDSIHIDNRILVDDEFKAVIQDIDNEFKAAIQDIEDKLH